MTPREQAIERGVVVIEFDYTRDAETNPLLAVVDAMREFFAARDDAPVGMVRAAVGGDADRVLAVFDPEPRPTHTHDSREASDE